MASHRVTIAKASLAAGFLRPDVTVVNRDGITVFHTLLETAISACSSSNIENCKLWLLQHVVPSPTRVGSLGKYLSSLSKHLQQEVKQGTTDQINAPTTTTLGRKRLHILYLLNDLLHHTKYHTQNSSHFSSLSSSLQPFIIDLVRSAALDDIRKVRARLLDLLSIWEKDGYYSKEYVNKLREAVAITLGMEASNSPTAVLTPSEPFTAIRDLPFTLTATHGDPSLPFFDLPAGNLMPHIMPNSSAAIRPDQVRALQFVAGPPDKTLVRVVKDFMTEVEKLETPAPADEEGIVADIDDLGQVSYRDENGEFVQGDTYYGWSRTFCEKMKKRRDGDDEDRPLRTRSYSSSRSPSRSPRKRRRYSDSMSSRSDSRSRSGRPRGRRTDENGHRNGFSPRRVLSGPAPRSKSSSYSPPVPDVAQPAGPVQNDVRTSAFAAHFQVPEAPQQLSAPFNMLPNQLPFQPLLGPNGLPLPPPPPPNYSGPWPPPNVVFTPGLPFPPPPTFSPSNKWFARNR